jgi:hypothetical protein
MALKKLPFRNVCVLLKHHLSTEQDVKAAALIRELRNARLRGYLTRAELEKVCRWKSPRAIRLIRHNSVARVRAATRRALATRSERLRLEALRTLDGVSVPMASAILTLLDPRRYGVIDIRVWQLLYALGEVTKKSSGIWFNYNNWYQFLMKLRYFAKKLRVSARDIERSLFFAHQANQKGTLYQRPPQKGHWNTISQIARYSRSHDAVIRVYDGAGNVIETHEHAGQFKAQ